MMFGLELFSFFFGSDYNTNSKYKYGYKAWSID